MAAIAGRKGARILTNGDPRESCGIRLRHLPGLDSRKVSGHLLKKHGIIGKQIIEVEKIVEVEDKRLDLKFIDDQGIIP